MATRTFKYFTIAATGTPQPLVGTTTTAAITPNIDPRNTQVSVPVADSSMFVANQSHVDLVDGAKTERHRVVLVPDATHIVIRNLGSAHASGITVMLADNVNSVYVQGKDGNTAALFLANSATANSTTGVGVIKKLQTVAANAQPNDATVQMSVGANPISLADLWVVGTNPDQYLVTAEVL